MRIILLSVFTITYALCSGTTAAPIMHESLHRYPIQGQSPDDLRSAMNTDGPTVEGGRYQASTESHVEWHVTYQMANGTCQILNPLVDGYITTNLPEWKEYSSSTPARQADWNTFIDKLNQHEGGHRQNGRLAADEIEAMLTTMPGMGSCQELEAQAKMRTDEIMKKYKLADMAYDRITRHGSSQHFS